MPEKLFDIGKHLINQTENPEVLLKVDHLRRMTKLANVSSKPIPSDLCCIYNHACALALKSKSRHMGCQSTHSYPRKHPIWQVMLSCINRYLCSDCLKYWCYCFLAIYFCMYLTSCQAGQKRRLKVCSPILFLQTGVFL